MYTGGLGKHCGDRCGNDDNYCSANTTCVVQNIGSPPLYTGSCILDAAIGGTKVTGDTCTGADCRYGALACFNGRCGEPCCKNLDCPAGYFCTLLGPAAQAGTLAGTGEIADTGMPICVPKTQAGTRVAGQACTANNLCASNFCEANRHVCVDKCCSDVDCATGTQCEYIIVQKPNGHVEAMRVCIALPAPPSGRLVMPP
jgi:hypothetical protein